MVVSPNTTKLEVVIVPEDVILLMEKELLASRRTIVFGLARAVAVVRTLDSVPDVIKDAFKLDNEPPAPANVTADMDPVAVMLLVENDMSASRRTIVFGLARAVAVVRTLDNVPDVIKDALRFDREAPSPPPAEKGAPFCNNVPVKLMSPTTCNLLRGLVVPIPTFPVT